MVIIHSSRMKINILIKIFYLFILLLLFTCSHKVVSERRLSELSANLRVDSNSSSIHNNSTDSILVKGTDVELKSNQTVNGTRALPEDEDYYTEDEDSTTIATTVPPTTAKRRRRKPKKITTLSTLNTTNTTPTREEDDYFTSQYAHTLKS